MNDTELKNKAIIWLEKQSKDCKTRPFPFNPKEVADAVSGTYTSLGRVAQKIVDELNARDVKVRYVKTGKGRFFELL